MLRIINLELIMAMLVTATALLSLTALAIH